MRRQGAFPAMPVYRCAGCGRPYEGEEPPEECPVCNAVKEQFMKVKD